MSGYNLSHLKQLEAESIHIIREAAAEFDNPVMLYSVGKDSSVMLHLAVKAFYPSTPLQLPAGTWWLVFYIEQPYSSYPFWGWWSGSNSTNGSHSVSANPGGGWSGYTTGWGLRARLWWAGL